MSLEVCEQKATCDTISNFHDDEYGNPVLTYIYAGIF